MRADLLVWTVRGAGFAIGAALILGVATIGLAAANVLLLVFIALLLASALEPVVGWIRARTGLPRGASILVVYAGFFIAVLALALIVVPAAVAQFNDIVAGLPPLLERARNWAADLRPRGLATSARALIDSAGEILAPPSPGPDDVVKVSLTVAEVAVSVGTILTMVFFWLIEHARIQRFALAFVPAQRRGGTRDAWNEIENRLGLWVRGQLILMGAIGLATGIANVLLGVPSALLLALIAAVTEAIPIVGPLLGAIPAVLVASTVSPELALIVAGVYLLLQIVESNVLVPLVMRNTIGLSPFLVVLSLVVGGAAGGLLGALFAVPVAAALLVILERLQARRIPVAQDPSTIESVSQDEATEMSTSLPDAAARNA
jgi:predicted PurR-regulated permease PerM